MQPRLFTLSSWMPCLVMLAVSSGVLALEGSLPPNVKSQVESENYWMNYNNMTVKDYVRELNKLKSMKVGVDPKLAELKTVPKLEFKDKTVVAGTEVLASALNAKVFFVRDFLYVAKELPAGITPTFAGDPPPADPKADPKKAAPAPRADAGPQPLTKLPAIFPGRVPGTSKVILWQRKSPAEARKEERPVVLLVADGDVKFDNPAAWYYDTLLLEDPLVMKALVDFTFIRVATMDAAGWPANITAKIKKGGAALLLLTCDGTVQQAYEGVQPGLTPQAVATAAAQVAQKNEAMKGKLPPPPPEPQAKADDRKGKLPGLPPPKKKEGEEEDEPDQKPGEKKIPEKKADNGDMNPPKKNPGMGPADE